jgi:signal transduction histidine kinase
VPRSRAVEIHPDMIERRTWLAAAWPAVLAALWVAAIAVSAYIANSMRDVNMFLDANHRAAIAIGAMSEDQRLHALGKPLATIAPFLVRRVDAEHGMDAAVVDDGGRLLAGNKDVLDGIVIPLAPKVGKGIPMPKPHGASGTLSAGAASAVQTPDTVTNQTFGQLPGTGFGPLSMPFGPASSMVKIEGGWLVIVRKADPLSNLGAWYWPFAGIAAVLSFVTVWTIGRRTLVHTVRPMMRVERGLRRLVDVNNATVEAIVADDDGLAAPLVASYNATAIELAEIIRQRTELEAQIRQFVADAGHELRTPLTVIMGYVQLLRQRSPNDSAIAERIFSEIDGQGQRMTLLIQKLLQLTRLETQAPRDVAVVDVTEIAQSVAASFEPLAGESTIEMRGDADAVVKMSESELRDAIGNLVDNAIKYAPGATVEINVRARNGTVAVTVSDDGPGMAPDVRARAFERFSRGETAGMVPGSGLGLAIVESAAERAGGSVSLQSTPGRGTSVELRLPAWHESDSAS